MRLDHVARLIVNAKSQHHVNGWKLCLIDQAIVYSNLLFEDGLPIERMRPFFR
jgi:hypothetical protein